MTMQSYSSRPFAGPRPLFDEFTNYRFFADFLDRDPFEPDDFEPLFDADFLLARALCCAVEADFVLLADFFAPPDFLALLLLAPRCFRSFSVSICSPRASIC